MAAAALTFDELRRDIKKENLAPVYLIHGKEGYYTDILVKDFENILAPEDKEFNQYVLYAPQTEIAEIIEVCSRFPMMAERQVVIVKEAQSARADQINKLAGYVNNPSPSTVLVIVFRGEEAKGKDLISAVKSKGVIYESKKVKDWQLPNLIQTYVKSKSMNIDGKSLEMLADYIGTDLGNLYNEIDKLALILGPGATITPASVELNIGISKDYNNFELVDALAAKDAAKVFRIAGYFASNPKANPLPVTTVVLYNFYSDLLIAFYAADKSDQGLMKELGLRFPMQLKKFKTAMRTYNAYQVIEAIWALRQFDNRSKGNGSRQDAYKLFHDLMFHLLSAPGKLY
ncbi:MAG: DNA polymerase III subunit delta [Muribaculaceae bacterium]|nr:DNA polymerase III subunit delta [Muribaculaceae bacterium]